MSRQQADKNQPFSSGDVAFNQSSQQDTNDLSAHSFTRELRPTQRDDSGRIRIKYKSMPDTLQHMQIEASPKITPTTLGIRQVVERFKTTSPVLLNSALTIPQNDQRLLLTCLLETYSQKFADVLQQENKHFVFTCLACKISTADDLLYLPESFQSAYFLNKCLLSDSFEKLWTNENRQVQSDFIAAVSNTWKKLSANERRDFDLSDHTLTEAQLKLFLEHMSSKKSIQQPGLLEHLSDKAFNILVNSAPNDFLIQIAESIKTNPKIINALAQDKAILKNYTLRFLVHICTESNFTDNLSETKVFFRNQLQDPQEVDSAVSSWLPISDRIDGTDNLFALAEQSEPRMICEDIDGVLALNINYQILTYSGKGLSGDLLDFDSLLCSRDPKYGAVMINSSPNHVQAVHSDWAFRMQLQALTNDQPNGSIENFLPLKSNQPANQIMQDCVSISLDVLGLDPKNLTSEQLSSISLSWRTTKSNTGPFAPVIFNIKIPNYKPVELIYKFIKDTGRVSYDIRHEK